MKALIEGVKMCCCALEVKKKDKAHEIPRDGMTIVKGHVLNCRMREIDNRLLAFVPKWMKGHPNELVLVQNHIKRC